MKTIRIEDAAANLSELVDSVSAGEDVVIVRNNKAVARLTSPVPAGASPTATSLRDLQPRSVGKLLRPIFTDDDDSLGEMLDR